MNVLSDELLLVDWRVCFAPMPGIESQGCFECYSKVWTARFYALLLRKWMENYRNYETATVTIPFYLAILPAPASVCYRFWSRSSSRSEVHFFFLSHFRLHHRCGRHGRGLFVFTRKKLGEGIGTSFDT